VVCPGGCDDEWVVCVSSREEHFADPCIKIESMISNARSNAESLLNDAVVMLSFKDRSMIVCQLPKTRISIENVYAQMYSRWC
jgi:hypothetical protein